MNPSLNVLRKASRLRLIGSKQQTYKIMLTNAIKVGKRLKEAKALLSQRTANRLKQLFEQYEDKLFTTNDDDGSSNSPAPTNLTHYQALLLLGILEDEREKFILRVHFSPVLTIVATAQPTRELLY
ncbi:Protein of unknown function [Desulfosporosinus lacus DSM 15449]|uniref:Uncharacterized protein n=1 Tax=Desulfosporosinus lacus DSM 15449 TaxID=1121420 RepID=A0A1M6B8Y2_9FIRM|nr:Protein of unknown function [Desulfosporosinus lacus DSM 15449]